MDTFVLFKASSGIHKGFPLSTFFFIIVAKTINKLISDAKNKGVLRGVKVSDHQYLSHLLYVDVVLYFLKGN